MPKWSKRYAGCLPRLLIRPASAFGLLRSVCDQFGYKADERAEAVWPLSVTQPGAHAYFHEWARTDCGTLLELSASMDCVTKAMMITSSFSIASATALYPDMTALSVEAASEGYRFVDRLIDDWLSAANKFEEPGERFFGGFQDGRLLAVCGLNRDPYTDQKHVGRLRHLYVLRSARGRGIASALVRRVLSEAKGTFSIVRLRTHSREATQLYERLGFVQVTDETSTHMIRLP